MLSELSGGKIPKIPRCLELQFEMGREFAASRFRKEVIEGRDGWEERESNRRGKGSNATRKGD